VAAGAILTRIADTTVPKIIDRTCKCAKLLTALGLLAAFAVSKFGG
jgi:hypothetical protein